MRMTVAKSPFIHGQQDLAGRFLAAVLLFFLFLTPAEAASFVKFISEPGDYIGQGAQLTFNTVTGQAFADQNGVTFQANAYTFDFDSAGGILAAGTYEGATRYPFNLVGEPGLDASGDGRGCNELKGRFIVHEIEFGAGTTLNKAAIDFEQHCEGRVPALYGLIRYNSDVGLLDQDGDALYDIQDNCPLIANANQLDTDNDGQGNVCDDQQGLTFVYLDSESGDYIGGGKKGLFTPQHGEVLMSDSTNSGYAKLEAGGYTYEFRSVDANTLTVGAYEDATRYPFNDPTEPGLDISGNGRGCNTLTGRFDIQEIERDNNGIITHFAAEFEQHCEGLEPALRGVIRYNSLQTDGDTFDVDGDGVLNHEDNCPGIANGQQVDHDNDDVGDICADIVTGDAALDRLGASVAYAGDVNGDGFPDYAIGMPGFDVPATPSSKILKDAGRVEVRSGANGAVLMSFNGQSAKESLGAAVAGGADIDGDTFGDVVVGAPGADDPMNQLADAGSVVVLYGPYASRWQRVYGTQAKSLFGSAVALGDTDSDSYADVVVGAPKADDLTQLPAKLKDAGSITVLGGDTLQPIYTLYGVQAKAYAGSAVATGHDFGGPADVAYVIFGAPGEDDLVNKRKDAGSVSIYSDADANGLQKRYGAVAGARFGSSVAAGDVNGDGKTDLIAGAPGDDHETDKDAGSVTAFGYAYVPGEVVKYYGAHAKDSFGNAVAVVDWDGDGVQDIIGAASLEDFPAWPFGAVIKDVGTVRVLPGVAGDSLVKLYGDRMKQSFGSAVVAGDFNDDGKADLLVGMPALDVPAAPDSKSRKDAGAYQFVWGE